MSSKMLHILEIFCDKFQNFASFISEDICIFFSRYLLHSFHVEIIFESLIRDCSGSHGLDASLNVI